jgi:hypothetical protein
MLEAASLSGLRNHELFNLVDSCFTNSLVQFSPSPPLSTSPHGERTKRMKLYAVNQEGTPEEEAGGSFSFSDMTANWTFDGFKSRALR